MMKELDNMPQFSKVNEGWTVHIYDGDRRLLCTLNPSHGWSLFAGLVLGIVLTLSCVKQIHPNPSHGSVDQPMSAPLSID